MVKCIFIVLAGILLFPVMATGDAIVVTRAMKASTIAEIFIARDSVTVELEIGVTDLPAFRNVLPDPIYERLGYDPESFEKRLLTFLTHDWVIEADGSKLPGRVTEILPRYRIIRDEVTGEPVPSVGEDREIVVFVRLHHKIISQPQSITLRPPVDDTGRNATATIGFVVYHEGLPVSDFRYLGGVEILDLDWSDPWYSRFQNRNLRRRFDSPISVYLYIENYEVRREIIARPRDLQRWIDLGLEDRDTIYVAEQEEIKRRVAEYFTSQNNVTIDGREAEPILDRIHFVRRSLRRTGVIDPPEDLPAISATLGVIFVYPVDSLPETATMAWPLFDEKIPKVPSSATDEAGGLPYFLTPGDSVLVWQNFLKNPTIPALVVIDLPRGGLSISLFTIASLLLLVILLAVSIRTRNFRSPAVLVSVAILLAAALLLSNYSRIIVPFPVGGRITQEDSESVIGGLLTNVYRAFDFRDEGLIYDTLERSASGDLLTQVYLETRKALELQNQGGARVKVNEVSVDSVYVETNGGKNGFTAQCTWTVSGSVGHWGHLHTRRNQYQALLTVQPVDGVWKIAGLRLLDEQRLIQGQL